LDARVFSEAHEGITITDAAGNIIDANPTFCAITGYTREEVIGRNHSNLQSGKHDAAFYKDLWQTLQTEGCWQGEIWNRKKSGELYVELLTISAMRNSTGEILNYAGLFSDITQAKLQQQELERMAHHDPLTQLPIASCSTTDFARPWRAVNATIRCWVWCIWIWTVLSKSTTNWGTKPVTCY
jgi:PAS domain S-box-containing protein